MASCVRCGKHRIRKNTLGVFNCRRCGPRHSDMVRLRAADELGGTVEQMPPPKEVTCC